MPVYYAQNYTPSLDKSATAIFGNIVYTATWQTIDVPPPLPFVGHTSVVVILHTSDGKHRREAAS